MIFETTSKGTPDRLAKVAAWSGEAKFIGERHKASAVVTPRRDYGGTSRAQGPGHREEISNFEFRIANLKKVQGRF